MWWIAAYRCLHWCRHTHVGRESTMPKAAITRCDPGGRRCDHAVGRCLRFSRHQSRWVVSSTRHDVRRGIQTGEEDQRGGQDGRIDRIGVRQAGSGERSSGPPPRAVLALDEDHGLTPAKPTDITPGCASPSGPRAGRGATVTADAVVVGASSGGQCQKTGGADNARGCRAVRAGASAAPWTPSTTRRCWFRSTAPTAAARDDGRVQRPDSLRRSAPGECRRRRRAQCIIAGGTNDTGGVLGRRRSTYHWWSAGAARSPGLKNQSRLLSTAGITSRRLHQHGDRRFRPQSPGLNGFLGDGRGDHLVPAVQRHPPSPVAITSPGLTSPPCRTAGCAWTGARTLLRWAVGVAGFSSASTVRNDHSMRICGHFVVISAVGLILP